METLESKGLVKSEVGESQKPCDETLKGVSGSCMLGEKCAESVKVSPLEASVKENVSVEVDSVSQVDVCTKGISLFVEVFGSLNGRVQGDGSNCLEEHVLVENTCNQENVCNSNGGLLLENGNASAHCGYEVEGGAIISQKQFRFSVGDFVWAKIKDHLWWPGIIFDPSKAPKDAAKCDHRDGLLVRCFGNGGYVRFLPSQLKPFVEYFEQMKGQKRNSNSFCGALEKSVAEFGRRVKMEMTCACFSKKLEEEKSDLGELSATQFEPESFVALIKDLAQEVSMPSKIDYIVTQNRLSAFYRSLGHSQIPMHQLKPACDAKAELISRTENNKDGSDEANYSKSTKRKLFCVENGGKAEKVYESRERRKSRYLSYPYVSHSLGPKSSPISGEFGKEDSEGNPDLGVDVNGQSMESTSMVKCKREKSQKQRPRKPITEHHISDKQVEKSLSSSEVLSELHFTALDCLYPNECEKFDSVEKFLSRFRKMAFRDFIGEISNERTVGQILPELEVQSDKGMNVENVIDVNITTDSTSVGGEDTQMQPLLNALPKKRGRKRKEKSTSSDLKTNPTSFLPDLKQNITTSGPVMIDFQNAVSRVPEVQSIPKKRKKVAGENQGHPQIEVMANVSVINGNSTILNFGDPQVTGPPQGKLEPKRRKKREGDELKSPKIISFAGLPDVNGDSAKLGPVLKEVPVMGPFSTQTIPKMNNMEGIKEEVVSHLDTVVTSGTLDFAAYSAQSQMGILSPGGKPEPKKRGRRKKTLDLPDLNGDAAENKPQKIRRRRNKNKAEDDRPCVNLTYKKLDNNGETSGTALLLKFGPDHPLPSKQDLVSAFCGFGPLKESETEAFSDSASAQLVFLSSSNAGEAFRCLQKSSPFGPALVNYRLQHLLGTSQVKMDGLKSPIKLSSGLKLKPQKHGEAPDLECIRKNLEMMTSMLEKAGDNLSSQMREKLESEIQGLLKRVSTMVGSSSSSYS